MKKTLIIVSFFMAISAYAVDKKDIKKADNKQAYLSGGKTTVFDTSHNAFSLPAKNLGILRRDNFFIGNAFFKQPWVSSPASTTARDGLGPLFNINTCQGCHVKDGRGRPPLTADEPFQSALVRLSIEASKSKSDLKELLHNGVVAEPTYGDQLQNNAIRGVKAEGTPYLEYTEIKGEFTDGETFTLQKPKVKIKDLQYGKLHEHTQFSVRTAPAMIGLGLLDAIKESDLLALADPEDKNADGISGKPNKVWDVKQKKSVIGRFGWKANQPNVEQQSAGAFLGDMGLTSSLFPNRNCSSSQLKCKQAPTGGDLEVTDEILEKVVFYASMLAVPARRDVNKPEVVRGEKLFNSSGCQSCHVAEFKTGDSLIYPELSQQTIRPYTDLLLHDMGEGLNDKRPDFEATGSEWRTAPLWGIDLVEKVNGHTRFMHDGRARNLSEAILWHGGEAEKSKQKYMDMNKSDRDALLSFINSL